MHSPFPLAKHQNSKPSCQGAFAGDARYLISFTLMLRRFLCRVTNLRIKSARNSLEIVPSARAPGVYFGVIEVRDVRLPSIFRFSVSIRQFLVQSDSSATYSESTVPELLSLLPLRASLCRHRSLDLLGSSSISASFAIPDSFDL